MNFYRKVGFGLGPNDKIPNNPLEWASRQVENIPNLIPEENTLIFFLDNIKQVKTTEATEYPKGLYELYIRHNTAVKTKSPVFEKFWHFWSKHLSLTEQKSIPKYLIGQHHKILRSNMNKSIAEMIYASFDSIYMMTQLDNNDLVSPFLLNLSSVAPKTITKDFLNLLISQYFGPLSENSKKLIRQINYVNRPEFLPFDQKEKNFILNLIKNITMDPDCIKFLSTKICKSFITDEPTSKMVDPIIKAWKSYDGNLPEIHKATIKVIFENFKKNKQLQTPENWLLQIVKMIDSNFPHSITKKEELNFIGYSQKRGDQYLTKLGDHPYLNKNIANHLINEKVWLTPELLFNRLVVAYKLTNNIRPEYNNMESVEKMVLKNFDKFDAEKILKIFLKMQDKQDSIQFLFNSTYGLRA